MKPGKGRWEEADEMQYGKIQVRLTGIKENNAIGRKSLRTNNFNNYFLFKNTLKNYYDWYLL